MRRIKHYTQLIILDTLAVIAMIAALLTGWLPGPGGIPLFILGLSLLAINHEWAKKYIDLLREHMNKISDLIFIPKLRVPFDILTVILLAGGVFAIYNQSAWWMISLGVFLIAFGVLIFFGNRDRWARLKKSLSKKL